MVPLAAYTDRMGAILTQEEAAQYDRRARYCCELMEREDNATFWRKRALKHQQHAARCYARVRALMEIE